MNVLLDTSVLLWWLGADPRLSAATRRVIGSAAQAVVSVVSLWEMSIKAGLGKLDVPGDILDRIDALDFRQLPVEFAHAAATRHLPDLHRDPFDRMLIAQAHVEGLAIVSSDRQFSRYDVAVIPAG